MPKFPHYLQPGCNGSWSDLYSDRCQPFWEALYNLDTLRELTWKTREGVSLLTISDAAEKIGFRTQGIRIAAEKLTEIPLPAIIH